MGTGAPAHGEGAWDGPVVDAHHHVWDPVANRHPWLEPDAAIPFRYGDYSALKRPYGPEEYRADARGHDVRETVYVEAEWDPDDPIGETRWVSGLADRHGLPNAIVAQAWLDRDDVEQVLTGQSAFALVRGVRHKPGGPARPDEVGPSRRTLMSDERWRAGYALLESHGLHFDLQTPWWNLPEAQALARDFPETTIVLNHAGLPADRSPDGLAGWRRAMGAFAEASNVRVKASGLGVAGEPWTVEANAPIVRDLVAMFGAERVMVGSNFPVDGLVSSYDTIMSGFKAILARYGFEEQRAMFWDTARTVYRTEGPA